MNYKSIEHSHSNVAFEFNEELTNQESFAEKGGKVYLSKIHINEIYQDICEFPDFIQAINNIENELIKIGAQNASVYGFLKNISFGLDRSPSPYPEDLAKMLLPTLISLINESKDDDVKTISLKILVFISLSTNEEITNLYDENMIKSIFKFVLSPKPFCSNNYIIKLIYACSILNNILICSEKSQAIYNFYIENELLQRLNGKLFNISSSQELNSIYNLIIQMLILSINYQEDINQFNFLIPSLARLISFSGNQQEKPLECLYLFLQDNNCLKECISNKIQNVLFRNINSDNIQPYYIHFFMKCINLICTDEIIAPFNDIKFYQKITDFIKTTSSKGIHEILLFFSKVIELNPSFDQTPLIGEILDNIESHSFKYKTECINFFIKLILDHNFRVPDELYHEIILCLLNAAYQFHEESLNGCLQVFNVILSQKNELSKEILEDPDFFDFLDECSISQTLNEECTSISSLLLQKYGDQ